MSERSIQIARQAYEAFNREGIEGILEFLDPEIEWRTWERWAREPRVYRGHEGVREVLQTVFFENFDDFVAQPHEFIDAEDVVMVPVRLEGRAKGTGDEVSFELVQVWALRGDRAWRLDVYSSIEEARAALADAG